MEYEHNCCNSIDLIENGVVVGIVFGPKGGDEDVTENELEIAQRICDGYNQIILGDN